MLLKTLLQVADEVVSRSGCGRLYHALGPATEMLEIILRTKTNKN